MHILLHTRYVTPGPAAGWRPSVPIRPVPFLFFIFIIGGKKLTDGNSIISRFRGRILRLIAGVHYVRTSIIVCTRVHTRTTCTTYTEI